MTQTSKATKNITVNCESLNWTDYDPESAHKHAEINNEIDSLQKKVLELEIAAGHIVKDSRDVIRAVLSETGYIKYHSIWYNGHGKFYENAFSNERPIHRKYTRGEYKNILNSMEKSSSDYYSSDLEFVPDSK